MDIIPLLRNIKRACKTTAMIIVDTNISSKPIASFTYEGKRFWGCYWKEHKQSADEKQRMDASWVAMKTMSIWLLKVLQMHF